MVDQTLVDLLEEGLAALPTSDSPQRAMATARLASELYFLTAEVTRRQQMTADAVAMAERSRAISAASFAEAVPGDRRPGRAPT